MGSEPKGPEDRGDNLRTAFLDRDGVINRKLPEGQYISRWEQFQLLPGAAQAIARLNRAGIRALVVTNQRGIGLGLYTSADVDALHAHLRRELKIFGAHIDGFYFCPHDQDECNCRKPLPGLFDQARTEFPEIAPATSVVIGDSLSDIEFGSNLNIRTVFIEGDEITRLHSKPGAQQAALLADHRCATLADAVEYLLT